MKNENINSEIIDLIVPLGAEFQKNYYIIGDVFCRVYAITNYPTTVEIGWESKITNIEGIMVKSSYDRVDPTLLIQHINKSISLHKGRMMSTKEAIVQERSKKAIKDYEELLKLIDQEQEAVFNKSTLITVIANSKEELDKKCSRVIGKISAMGVRAKTLIFKQKEGFEAAAPFNFVPEDIKEKCERNMPVSTIAGAFPFSASGLNDNKGILLGEDITRGGVILDIWKREGDRTNSNFTVLGNPGVGKSATVKKIIYNEWLRGAKVIVIDPEREYRDLCENLNGDWINAGGGIGGRINPLEVKSMPLDDDNLESTNGLGPLALHFQTLRTFFKLYADLSNTEMAALEELLEKTYQEFDITFETKDLSNKRFPIMEDLYSVAIEVSENFEKVKAKEQENHYQKVVALIRSACIGADKALWNGETNIKSDSEFICIDTFDLQKADERIQRSQYFNILTYAWEIVSRDRSEKVLLIIDEAYLLIDPKVPEALMYVRNFSKRIRKYEGGLGIISHSVVDFISPEVKRYGQAVMDNPTYKILMGTDGKNLQELASLYDLTEAEQELLNNKRRGHALLIVGNKRLHSIVKLEQHEMRAFGKGGGR